MLLDETAARENKRVLGRECNLFFVPFTRSKTSQITVLVAVNFYMLCFYLNE